MIKENEIEKTSTQKKAVESKIKRELDELAKNIQIVSIDKEASPAGFIMDMKCIIKMQSVQRSREN
jgi:hypothetical protein